MTDRRIARANSEVDTRCKEPQGDPKLIEQIQILKRRQEVLMENYTAKMEGCRSALKDIEKTTSKLEYNFKLRIIEQKKNLQNWLERKQNVLAESMNLVKEIESEVTNYKEIADEEYARQQKVLENLLTEYDYLRRPRVSKFFSTLQRLRRSTCVGKGRKKIPQRIIKVPGQEKVIERQ